MVLLSDLQSGIMAHIDLTLLFLTAIAGIFAWWFTEWAKRSGEAYNRKEEKYKKLIEGYKGCYEPADPALQKKFIDELNLCWLYCPDDVIQKGNDLLTKAHEGATQDDIDKAASEFVLTIRKDALKRWPWDKWRSLTKLNPADFKAWRTYVLKVEPAKFQITGGAVRMTHRDKNGNVIPPPLKKTRSKPRPWWKFWLRCLIFDRLS